MKTHFTSSITLLLLGTIFSFSLYGQQIKNEGPIPEIAFLGTFHFAGSTDAIALKVEDIETEKRQAEIKEMVDNLADYKPTKVLLEYPYGNKKLDSLYQQYLKGEHKLSINESQQIGFRLAKKMGHNKVYAVDERMDIGFDELNKYLQENNEMHRMQELMEFLNTEVLQKMQQNYDSKTMSEFLVYMNQDEMDRSNRGLYLEYLNEIGTAENPVGVKMLSKWWERNFRIMRNIDEITDPNDRIFVLFGQGHTSLFKDFYKDRTDVKMVDITEYLD